MSEVERLNEGLSAAWELVNQEDLEPDPKRADWRQQRDALDRLLRLLQQDVLGAGQDALAALADETERANLQVAIADHVGPGAAVLYAAGRETDARAVLADSRRLSDGCIRSPLMAAAESDLAAYCALERAFWLLRKQRRGEALKLAKPLAARDDAIAEHALDILRSPKPVKRPPSLHTVNGVGLTVYGSRDEAADGTYTTTRYLVVLLIPVLPIDAFRVADAEGGGYYFLGKVPLGPVAKLWRSLVAVLTIGVIGTFAIRSYTHSPERRFGRQAQAIAEDAGHAMTAEARSSLLQRYEDLLRQYPSVDPSTMPEIGKSIAALSTAGVPRELATAQFEQARRAIRAFRALPGPLQRAAASAMGRHIERWAASLTRGPEPALRAAVQLLEEGLVVADSAQRPALEHKRAELIAELAQQIAADWPLDAVRLYVSAGAREQTLRAAGKLLEGLRVDHAVWNELAPTVERWQHHTKQLGLNGMEPLAQRLAGRVAQARTRMANQTRRKLLESGSAEALSRALGREPGDQELAIALARRQRSAGDARAALTTLQALGPDATLTGATLQEKANVLGSLGQFDESERLLQHLLDYRVPDLERARRAYHEAVIREREKLLARARQHIPGDLEVKLEGASEAEQGDIVSRWLSQKVDQVASLKPLRDRYMALTAVVPAALMLGRFKLRRAQASGGHTRQMLLDQAERAFLSIQSEAQGTAAYHLNLGQVYYRLGKKEKGKQELETLLKQNDPALKLAVARAFRELGLSTRARALAKEVHRAADEQAVRSEAAHLLALLATTTEDRRRWLRQANTQNRDPSAKPEAHVIWPCDPRGDKGGRNGWTKDTGQRGRAGVPEGGTGSAGAEPGAVGAAAGHRRAVARGVAQELSAPRQRRLG
jgi:tetratricopeptide (TPR) repeat protein